MEEAGSCLDIFNLGPESGFLIPCHPCRPVLNAPLLIFALKFWGIYEVDLPEGSNGRAPGGF